MNEAELAEIERQVKVGCSLPGRDRYALETMGALLMEARRLRRLLVEYGRHSEGCNAQWGDTYRCRCGWREAERAFLAPADQTNKRRLA